MSMNTKANIKKIQGRAVAQDTPPLTSLSSSKASTLPSADERPLTAAEVLFRKQTLRTVVIALLIDILAFTIILPLLPRLIVHYEQTDGQDPTTLYYAAASTARTFRTWIGGTGSRLDIVLFGGFLGSLFSFLQFLSSPVIGSLSDKFGRRNVLLISMIGNGISMMLWIFSGSFSVFMWSRIIGGLTEGNVQMSIAIISDITSSADRSKTLAWVGISFALGFTVGPPIGAYLASFDLHEMLPSLPVNRYSSPALFAFALIVIETVYLYAYLPETSHLSISRPSMPVPEDEHDAAVISNETPDSSASGSVNTATPSTTQDTERKLLVLSLIHFGFLFSFSGMEFTLTFLTHDRFDFTPMQQGKLLAYMGVLSAFIQGGYVRRVAHKYVSEQTLILQGIISCAIGLHIVGRWATTIPWLYIGVAFLAFTSGTVVNSLTSLASLTHQAPTLGAGAEASLSTPSASRLAADSQNKKSNRGHVLGKFRSLGQLGRSIGPLVACSGYWIMGSSNVYSMASIAMTLLGLIVYFVVPSPIAKKLKKD
ncbi:hypothetical protein BASA50_000027 [Batrachochytrium salamandrivorans]|uniref:Major facilitator superfamily (MFS) profile domain-containing protein n=1 Tax=Batrachochytrium salamandrivorans TaxID=1357716 RepID=A0ABQ8EUT5_9FUNG|nr:hypothetical protein BASA50_000027 [Batrachochytrium salamandrivorans]